MDGSTVQLFADKVIVSGQTVSVPQSFVAALILPFSGGSVTAQPGASTKPANSEGGGKKKGLSGALGGLVGGVKAATEGIATIGQQASKFLSGASDGASGLAASLSGAVGSVDAVVSSLNGIQDAFPAEAIGKAGLDVFSKA